LRFAGTGRPLVQVAGKPIKQLTHSGFSCPPSLRADVSSEGFPRVAYCSRPSPGSPLFDVPYTVALGVGQRFSASTSLERSRPSFECVGNPPFMSRACGVGHVAATSRSSFVQPGGRVSPSECVYAIGVGHNLTASRSVVPGLPSTM
jgi:hypothetical protein